MVTNQNLKQLKEHKAFQVEIDNMAPVYRIGDVVICHEIIENDWDKKLPYHDYDFVIDHKTEGLMLRQIVDQYLDKGEIVCHSLGNESDPDLTIELNEVTALYLVIEHRIPGKKNRK